jgi:hypothetical protein
MDQSMPGGFISEDSLAKAAKPLDSKATQFEKCARRKMRARRCSRAARGFPTSN